MQWSLVKYSDVKFREIFCLEIFHEIFLKYFKNSRCLSIVHCNKVSKSKPVKGKYLLLCMNSIMYLLLTLYTLIVFLKVLSHLTLKIKSFRNISKRVLKYFKIFMNFLNISNWNGMFDWQKGKTSSSSSPSSSSARSLKGRSVCSPHRMMLKVVFETPTRAQHIYHQLSVNIPQPQVGLHMRMAM